MIHRRVFPLHRPTLLSPTGFHEVISGRRRGALAAVSRALLRAAEVPYTWAIQRRNRRFERGKSPVHRVAVPVVSVGNITAGGTGKTPLVAWLAQWFSQRNLRVALVSRGYGAQDAGANDEARELAQRLPGTPHLQDPDRVAAAQLAIERHGCQVLVLDDAFQHRRIHRDLDIVLVDALQPFGYRHLLPRGLLREPLDQLARADLIALSRCDAVSVARRRQLRDEITAYAPRAAWVELIHQPSSLVNAQGATQSVAQLAGESVAAFAGIGNPHGFYHSLQQLGCDVVARREFPDHHHYSRDDMMALQQWLAGYAQLSAVICTCKDLVKMDATHIGRVPLWALSIDVQVAVGREELERHLQAIVPYVG